MNRRTDLLAAGGLSAATLLTRLPGLGRPSAFVFDEIYYVPSAVDVIVRGVDRSPVAHPPVGPFVIAAGVRVFGLSPAGWRSSALVAGALVVGLVYLAARGAGVRPLPAALAAVLASVDGIAFTSGRLAMLDVFVALFVAAVLGLTVVERRWRGLGRPAPAWLAPALGVSLGLGAATKWSVWFLAPVVLASLVARPGRARDAAGGTETPPPPARRRLHPALTVAVLAPLTYLAAYGPWFLLYDRTPEAAARCGVAHDHCDFSWPARVGAWFDQQRDLVHFHSTLRPNSNQAASGLTWVLQTEPVGLYVGRCPPASMPAAPDGVCQGDDSGRVARELSVGNPIVWAAGFGALGGLAVRALRRSDDVALVVVALGLVLWLPFVVTARAAYSFYGAALVPVLALAVALAPQRSTRRVPWPWMAVTGVALVMFGLMLPLLTAQPLGATAAAWRRIWPSWP